MRLMYFNFIIKFCFNFINQIKVVIEGALVASASRTQKTPIVSLFFISDLLLFFLPSMGLKLYFETKTSDSENICALTVYIV